MDKVFSIKGVKEDKVKLDYVFLYGGDDLEKIYQLVKQESDGYKEVIAKLTAHFNPKINSTINILHFRDIYQFPDEPFESFIDRLREKAKTCNFKDEKSEIILQIIHRLSLENLKRKFLSETDENKKTLDEVVKIGKLEETIEAQLREMSKRSENELKYDINRVRAGDKVTSSNRGSNHESNKPKRLCFQCGNEYPHEKECPAKKAECRKCGEKGHFARCCKARNEPRVKKKVGRVTEADEGEHSSRLWAVRAKVNKVVNSIKNWFMPMVALLICGSSIGFTVDTGAEVNIMDEAIFKKLKYKPKLEKCKTVLFGYGQASTLETLGKFKTRCLFSS